MLSLYAANRNKVPILSTLHNVINGLREGFSHPFRSDDTIRAIEVASGTGEHAAYFTENISNLFWLPTELDATMMESINAYGVHTKYADNSQIMMPAVCLDMMTYTDDLILPEPFRNQIVDVVVCINMIHISPVEATTALFKFPASVLRPSGVVFTYNTMPLTCSFEIKLR